MKKLVIIIALGGLVAASTLAFRQGCNAALVTEGLCRDTSKVLWGLDMSQAADAKFQSAMAKRAGWTATVVCTQAMVDLGQCTVEQIGQQVTNPQSERNAAKGELKAWFRAVIRSGDAEAVFADAEAVRVSGLAAITEPDLGD